MKGLFVKDLYMSWKYFKSIAVLSVIFIVAAIAVREHGDSVMPLSLICVLWSMIPVSLYSYDEREKGTLLTAAFPTSRAKYISEKYIFGLICNLVSLAVALTASYFNMNGKEDFLLMSAMSIYFSFLIPSVVMPFMVRFGSDLGRTLGGILTGGISSVFIGVYVGIFQTIDETSETILSNLDITAIFYIVDILTLLIYALSWLLSIYLYNRKEL